MAFYGYNGDFNECYWTPSGNTYDEDFAPSPVQPSYQFSSSYEYGKPVVTIDDYSSAAYFNKNDSSFGLNYSIYNYTEPKTIQLESVEYNSSYFQYENSVNPSEISYSTYHQYSEARFLQYDPSSYDRGYIPSATTFSISYSTVGSDRIEAKEEEFNEPDFEEYDPTPYGGGYDPAATYGKPLPPSDKTCYPRSVPQSDSMSAENFSYSSIPSLYATEDGSTVKPKEIETKPDTDDSRVDGGDKDTGDSVDDESRGSMALIPIDDSPTHDEDEHGLENGASGGFGYESERQEQLVPYQIAYGSGLESMDLCESIFGYWPCLAKMERQERLKCHEVCDRERRNEPWSIAADYLFGNPLVYDYENYLHHNRPRYEYDYRCTYGDSWMH